MKCIFHGVHVNHGHIMVQYHGYYMGYSWCLEVYTSLTTWLYLHGSLKMCIMHLELTATDFLFKLLVIYACML